MSTTSVSERLDLTSAGEVSARRVRARQGPVREQLRQEPRDTMQRGRRHTLKGTRLTCRIALRGLSRSFWLSCRTGLRLYRSCVGLSSPRSAPSRVMRFLEGEWKLKRGLADAGELLGEVVAV